MTTGKLDVSTLLSDDVMWTLLGTLYLRAYESRSPHSILRDHYAAEALERIEYDEPALARRLRPKTNQFLVALRGKQLDTWTTAFLDRHPDATVLQVGCGLDSRALRLQKPKNVRWYDLDLPDVIAIRRRLFEERDGHWMIAASVTDDDWLRAIPNDRPTLIIAEGLFPYLQTDDVRKLLQRLSDHFGTGELLFDSLAQWMTRFIKVFVFSFRDGHEIESGNNRLRLQETSPFSTFWPLIHSPGIRRLYQVGHKFKAWRNLMVSYRFTF
ncbi:class I SAM-dependent methyltransferase [Tenggerimyces flavus]|uniref:Class I SAM-dependent methyltransferase n=1 Tax=Tenggerimyces flavus TaxID=1708749 RepID=A0ABV7Y4H7_9ACTN|nr:class I SAM-dependent methyltransferase [Tenggerimyces flavus]MBM7788253.1 methyltransferase (TIGR00027 family) [Tenggerimyces flavus]